MLEQYKHLLSPIKIGNVVLKNRMISTKAVPPGMKAEIGETIMGQKVFAQPADAIHFYDFLASVKVGDMVSVNRSAFAAESRI